jgi:hypothetical protein
MCTPQCLTSRTRSLYDRKCQSFSAGNFKAGLDASKAGRVEWERPFDYAQSVLTSPQQNIVQCGEAQ